MPQEVITARCATSKCPRSDSTPDRLFLFFSYCDLLVIRISSQLSRLGWSNSNIAAHRSRWEPGRGRCGEERRDRKARFPRIKFRDRTRLRMAGIPPLSDPTALQELNGDFKKPALPMPPAVRGKFPTTNPSNPEEVKEGSTALLDSDSGEPDVPPARPDSVENRSPPEEQPRLPTAAPAPGSPALAPPYREPPWGSPATAPYSLETLKGGTILGTRSLKGTSCCLFGRLSSCDVCLEHPSVSRYHAVLQHGASGSDGECDGLGPGFYLYDLGSTHGTFLNKTRVAPRTYCRVHVGHVLRFGGSTRLFLLQVSRKT